MRDLRYSIRSLARTPLLTAALLATVAVGAGTHATVSAFVSGLFANTAALNGDRRLVGVHWRDEAGRFAAAPRARFEALRARTTVFETLAAFRESRASVSAGGRQSWVTIVQATPDLWRLLPLPAVPAGSGPAEAAPGVVIGDRFWRNALGGRPDVTGASIRIDGRSFRI